MKCFKQNDDPYSYLIATDDSKHSRDVVKEFAARPMGWGALRQYYREVEEKALKAAMQAAEHAAKILRSTL